MSNTFVSELTEFEHNFVTGTKCGALPALQTYA